MNKLLRLTVKGFIMCKILFEECFCRCYVVKMSVTQMYNGKLLKSNWGDDINYWFLNEVVDGKVINYDWSVLTKLFKRPYITGIGSILTLFDMDKSIVWGTGIISGIDMVNGKPNRICAVRGPLTREKLLKQGIPCPKIFGDPALLISQYYMPKVEKRYKLGIIPHYVDKETPLLAKFKNDKNILFIDIVHYADWLDFIDQINQCELVASSSLHGLIMSEAYAIPNVWIKIEGSELIDEFKFHDFFLSLGSDRSPLYINEETTLNKIFESGRNWKKGIFDLHSLKDACPFKLKQNYKISR